ncbi:MAG: DAK2 domain-containing protein [Erysipelotrichaceae bacterium]|jgi:DAK2 domain fusion protein YloV|nr:DAK2 domain-containing protein [Erysipelotrichaceae bacterium]
MKTIDGIILKQILISGANNLYNHYPEVDALNVFPVPDGDTGMNMNLTMTSGAKEIQNRNDKNIYEIAKTFSKGLLMGARGNSGVITSQIFRGFANALEGKEEVSARELVDAWNSGVEVAYKAVMKPVEGTILTVIREASDGLAKRLKSGMSIDKAFEIMIEEAERSLNHTPELLPILKQVGVVDSGGYGLLIILKGMKQALDGAMVERNAATATENPIVKAGSQMESEEFGYCTEFIMELGPDSVKRPFSEKRFSSVLGNRGNSLVVVRDEEIVKVHVHTLNPGDVLNYAQQFGEFKTLKIENMTEQHHALETGAKVEPHVDLVTKPEEKAKYAIIAVSSGDGIDNFFKEIGVKEIVKGGQTMNPSTEDFIAAIRRTNAENVIILPNNSNIVMAASQAADVFDEENINCVVVPSKTIPQGITAVINFNPDVDIEENAKEMKAALKNVKSGSVTFSVRNTEINNLKFSKNDFIGIFDKDIVSADKNKINCTKELINKMVDENSSIITILVGEDVTDKEKQKLEEEIAKHHSDLELDIRNGGQPVYSFLIGIE